MKIDKFNMGVKNRILELISKEPSLSDNKELFEHLEVAKAEVCLDRTYINRYIADFIKREVNKVELDISMESIVEGLKKDRTIEDILIEPNKYKFLEVKKAELALGFIYGAFMSVNMDFTNNFEEKIKLIHRALYRFEPTMHDMPGEYRDKEVKFNNIDLPKRVVHPGGIPSKLRGLKKRYKKYNKVCSKNSVECNVQKGIEIYCEGIKIQPFRNANKRVMRCLAFNAQDSNKIPLFTPLAGNLTSIEFHKCIKEYLVSGDAKRLSYESVVSAKESRNNIMNMMIFEQSDLDRVEKINKHNERMEIIAESDRDIKIELGLESNVDIAKRIAAAPGSVDYNCEKARINEQARIISEVDDEIRRDLGLHLEADIGARIMMADGAVKYDYEFNNE